MYITMRQSPIGAGFGAPQVQGELYILTGRKPIEIEDLENAKLLTIQASKGALRPRAAANMAVMINYPGAPEAPFPVRLPNTGFNNRPLPSQIPNPVHALG